VFIAVNLQLIVVHGISTTGFIKYYVGCAWLATTAIGTVSAVYHVWGWNPRSQICYMAISDPAQRRFWTVVSLQAWTLLSTTVCVICMASVLVRLLRTRAHLQQALATNTCTSKVRINQFNRVAWRVCAYPAILSAYVCFVKSRGRADGELVFVNAVGVPASIYLNSGDRRPGPPSASTMAVLCLMTAIYAFGHMLLGLTAIFIEYVC
jgi:hypothetical protein